MRDDKPFYPFLEKSNSPKKPRLKEEKKTCSLLTNCENQKRYVHIL
jgi:hypothetical protein